MGHVSGRMARRELFLVCEQVEMTGAIPTTGVPRGLLQGLLLRFDRWYHRAEITVGVNAYLYA